MKASIVFNRKSFSDIARYAKQKSLVYLFIFFLYLSGTKEIKFDLRKVSNLGLFFIIDKLKKKMQNILTTKKRK